MIEKMDLMQQYDKDKEKSRRRWLKGKLSRTIKVSYLPSEYRIQLMLNGQIASWYDTEMSIEEIEDEKVQQEIDRIRGK